MFWIFGRKSISKPERADRLTLSPLYEGDRGLNDLSERDAELRVWLPTSVDIALSDIAEIAELTVSSYLRQFFVLYLYGAHEYQRMRINQTGIFYEPPPQSFEESSSGPMFSRTSAANTLPELGKNIEPLKIYVASKIKQDLQAAADRVEVPLSRFIREILISHLLGHTILKEHQFWSNDEEKKIRDLES